MRVSVQQGFAILLYRSPIISTLPLITFCFVLFCSRLVVSVFGLIAWCLADSASEFGVSLADRFHGEPSILAGSSSLFWSCLLAQTLWLHNTIVNHFHVTLGATPCAMRAPILPSLSAHARRKPRPVRVQPARQARTHPRREQRGARRAPLANFVRSLPTMAGTNCAAGKYSTGTKCTHTWFLFVFVWFCFMLIWHPSCGQIFSCHFFFINR